MGDVLLEDGWRARSSTPSEAGTCWRAPSRTRSAATSSAAALRRPGPIRPNGWPPRSTSSMQPTPRLAWPDAAFDAFWSSVRHIGGPAAWRGAAYVRTVGKRVERRYAYAKSRKKATAKLVELQRRRDAGVAAGSATLTVEAFLIELLAPISSCSRTFSTAYARRPWPATRTTSGCTSCLASARRR